MTDFTLVGLHDLEIILSDGQPLSTKYVLKLNVTNTPPYFIDKLPEDLRVRFNHPHYYELPAYTDDEGH